MWLDTAKEIINELENISIEDYQTKMQRQKKKKKTEYPRIMGQLQEKQYKHYWNIREEIKK